MSKQLQIRNSTAEFLIFQAEDKAQGVQVFYKDETIWATQKAMAALFNCSTDNIGAHLKIGVPNTLTQDKSQGMLPLVVGHNMDVIARLG